MKQEDKLSPTYDTSIITNLYQLMKKKMPKFDLVYDQEDHIIYTPSQIHHKTSSLYFYAQMSITHSNYLSIMFYFGDVPINNRNLFLVNEFNESCQHPYKAYLRKKKDEKLNAYFDIEYNGIVKDAKEAYQRFHDATNYLNESDMTQLIKFLYKPYNEYKEVDYKIMN